ncbi:hypothetical protein ACIOD2_29355 [Amycolatopsis sp. NPDC088138]|uniref:hypothetical protein n=1 Tax=Amycolatopsis sp. NPDC088138 TaxID=3363938 RepID=UPI00382F7F2A
MDGAYSASQSSLLLDKAGSSLVEAHAARLLRNGLSVTCFAAFEGFFRERTSEISNWLTSQAIPFSQYPAGLHSAALQRGTDVLQALMRRDPSSGEVKRAVIELGESWSRMQGGAGWRLPHAALLWPGSNLGAGETMQILTSFGVVASWPDFVGVAEAGGFANLPTRNLFDEIASRRHLSAHESAYDADILLLRATPANLKAFAFSLDCLLSHAARAIARRLPISKGRNAVNITRLDEMQGKGGWDEYKGPVSAKVNPAATHVNLDDAVSNFMSASIDPTDVLLVRKWNGIEHEVVMWYTTGV